MVTKTTHPYKTLADGSSLVIDRYCAEAGDAPAPRPAMIFFHGGGWHDGTRDRFKPQATVLAERGMVGFSVEYRTRTSHDVSPQAALSDAKSALRWVRAHARELGVDPDRIGTGGGSAGGHLAAAAIMCPGFDDPADDRSVPLEAAAFVLFNPVLHNGPEGYGHGSIEADFPAFSPAHNIRPGLPPTLLHLGTEDHLIPVAILEAFTRDMRAVGNRCDLRLYEGAGHGFFNPTEGNTAWFRETMENTCRFLEGLGWID